MKLCGVQNCSISLIFLDQAIKAESRQWSGFSKFRFVTKATLNFSQTKYCASKKVLTRKVREQQTLQLVLVVGAGGPNSTSASGGGGRGHWQGSVPYFCISMSLTQDNVKCLFLTRTNSQSCQELDAQNSDSRSVWQPAPKLCSSFLSFLQQECTNTSPFLAHSTHTSNCI
jgi:hypothetical protein